MSSQPRPVVIASRVISGSAVLAGAFPTVARAFGWIEWTAAQGDAYFIAVNAVIAAVGLWFGLRAERQVTPVTSPKDMQGVPMVPIAVDGLDD